MTAQDKILIEEIQVKLPAVIPNQMESILFMRTKLVAMRPHIIRFPAKVSYLNFHPLEVVSRYRETQLQVGENYLYMFNLRLYFVYLDV